MRFSLPFRILSLLCFTLVTQHVFAQQKNIPLGRFYNQEVERTMLADSVNFYHGASKPILESDIDVTKVYGLAKDTMKIYYKSSGIFFKHHLLSIKKDDFFLAIDPLFDFTFGKDFADTTSYSGRKLFTNQRGVQFLGDIGKKFSFQTCLYETQTFVPLYLKHFVDSTGTFPGFGRTKPYNLNGYDFAMANGWISYSPVQGINLQFGNGKNFIGHGYRSLLLSDAAFSYPYLKAQLTSKNKKWQYTAMYASLSTLERLPRLEVPESAFKRKGGSFNYISWLPTPSLELGFFEGVIWERYDSTGTKPQSYGAYLPVVGVNTALNGFGNSNHVLIGMNAKFRTSKHSFVYGQIATDNPGKSYYGFQLGAKYFDLLVKNLDVQIEWNNLPPFLYSSHEPLQSYSHMNQPLGSPTGPATDEVIAILNYRYHRLFTQVKYNNIYHSLGTDGMWNADPDIAVIQVAPSPVKLTSQWEAVAGVNFNTNTNFQILVGYVSRTERTDYNWMDDTSFRTSYLYMSLRTNLINRYTDF